MAQAQRQSLDIREMSFQNVVDQILKPNGVKMGGFPDDIFIDLSDDEQTNFICNICYMILNEPRECINKHLFCETCVFAWSMTYGENSQKCPVCRCEQKKYEVNREIRRKIWDKKVKCPHDKCDYTASLRAFLMHNHGKERFCNEHVKFDELRPERPDGARLLVLPSISLQGSTRMERVSSLRDQIHQGRMMIHQMMLLLHLEMQLRQQALDSYSRATDPADRLQRLDEVMALNEQLNEVGGVLSTLLNSPINNIIGASRDIHNRAGESAVSRGPPVSELLRMAREPTDLSDSDSSSASEESQAQRFRMDFRASRVGGGNSQTRRIDLSHGPPAVSNSPGPGLSGMLEFEHRNQERERSALAAFGDIEGDENIPEIPNGRHLSDYSQAGAPDIHPRVLMGGANSVINMRQGGQNSQNNNTVEETTRSLNVTNTRDINTRSTTPALPNISGNANSVVRQSTTVSQSNIPQGSTVSQSNRPQGSTNALSGGARANVSSTGASAPSPGVASPQRLLSARTRAQAPTLSTTNPTSDSNTRTSITYQSSLNTGSSTTPRAQNTNQSEARSGPTIGPAIEVEEPILGDTTTPRFEQRNAFRVSNSSSSTSVSRASSASRRSSTQTSPNRETTNRQPRYAPRIRQPSQNFVNRNSRPTNNQRTADPPASQSPDRNNNRPLNRSRDVSNRLSNRRSLSNARSSEINNSTETESDLVPKPPARRRSVAQNNSSNVAPRGPGTSGQLMRARRRSEIQQELMKSRENAN